ncbi:MAG: GCN5-related N-acetyltransferase [Sphingomonadaceae bacterium]|nr:GCN5-related N-acetyltransferase [Sphingomonadaceae bacterium]
MTDRPALRAAIDAAVARLVARAATERWPVRADHCFLRIAYDAAAGAKWDTVYARPAWASLPEARLAAALAVLERIEAEGRAALDPLNAASLAFRRAAR